MQHKTSPLLHLNRYFLGIIKKKGQEMSDYPTSRESIRIHLSRSRDSRKTYGRRVKKKEGSQEPPPGRCARDIIRERGHTDPESQQAARCGTQRHFLRPQIPFPSVGKRHKACRPRFVSTRAPLSIAIEEGRKERKKWKGGN